MLSAAGEMDIEQVAEERPDELARLHVNPLVGLQPHQARWLAFHAKIDPEARAGVVDALDRLYAPSSTSTRCSWRSTP